MALHKQPEASVDVLGRYYEDQYLNILNLWRVLPDDWVLLVKEHTNAIGDRSLSFYNKINSLKNTYFLHEKEDSHEIIFKSCLVATISGTVAYEVALLSKPSITFAPTFFNASNFCKNITLEDLKYCNNINDLLSNDSSKQLNDSFQSDILSNSYEGIISDYLSDPRCMDEKNIHLITNSIISIL